MKHFCDNNRMKMTAMSASADMTSRCMENCIAAVLDTIVMVSIFVALIRLSALALLISLISLLVWASRTCRSAMQPAC